MNFETVDTASTTSWQPGPASTLGDGWQKDGYFTTMHSNTPLVQKGGETFMDKFDRDQFCEERRQNLYYPFANRDDWEMAYWLLNSGLSMTSINKFLSLRLVSDQLLGSWVLN